MSRLGIRPKMLGIISGILLVSLGGMISLATYFFLKDNKDRVQEANLNMSGVIGDNIVNTLNAFKRSATLTADALLLEGESLVGSRIWKDEKNLLYIGLYEKRGSQKMEVDVSIRNRELLSLYNLDPGVPSRVIQENQKDLMGALYGQTVIKNVSGPWSIPLLAIAFPYEDRNGEHRSLTLVLRSDALLDSFQSSGITESFLVDFQGNLILHPDRKKILARINMMKLPIVKAMVESQVGNGQIRYLDDSSQAYLGAFKTLPDSGTGVISTVPEALAYEEVYNIQRRNIYLLIVVLNLAVLIVYFFARGITLPIRKLVEAVREVERGNYHFDLINKTRDELGLLTHSFQSMTRGLQERENLRESFGKFVNKDIAEMSLTGQLKLGGERKECAIFFSDIRGFTSMSEKTDPAEVVDFLNEYFSAMVACVNETNGSVDKFIGDALMAVWGALRKVENPSYNAVLAALKMRTALIEFNRTRKSLRKPEVHIGCGINRGPVIAGQIGSDQKVEYTVIGDAVNLASRTESLCKTYVADILITENVYHDVKELVHVEKMERLRVKGKTQAITIYAVLGLKSDPQAPTSMAEVRKRIGMKPPEGAKVRK